MCNVKYTLGGRENNIDLKFVSRYDLDGGKRIKEKVSTEVKITKEENNNKKKIKIAVETISTPNKKEEEEETLSLENGNKPPIDPPEEVLDIKQKLSKYYKQGEGSVLLETLKNDLSNKDFTLLLRVIDTMVEENTLMYNTAKNELFFI